MKAQIAIIAPYGALKGEARAAVEELGLNVLVREGDLAKGVRAAQRAVRDGVEVLISRGGIALGIYRLWEAGKIAEANQLQDRLRPLRDVMKLFQAKKP